MHICIYVYVITIFLETNYLFIVLYVGQLQTSEFIQFFSLIRRAFPLTFSRNESNAVLRTRADGKCLSQLAHLALIFIYIMYITAYCISRVKIAARVNDIFGANVICLL